MAQRDEKGRFVRTKPDYKAMYEAECIKRASFEDDLFVVKKERDEYKKKHTDAISVINDKKERLCFLLDHAGPILRWMYNRKFKKGE